MLQAYEWFLWGMAALAVVVFVALYHVKAGYGLLRDGRWGPKIGNRLGWFLMESPVFIAMCLFWFCSSRRFEATPLVFFGLFQLHYLNRAFIYPLLLKGQSKMPLGIIDVYKRQLSGCLVVRDRCLQLNDLTAVTDAGELTLTALYATRSHTDITTGFDLEMKKIQVDRLIKLLPSVDTMLPMLRSFEGVVDCQLAAAAALDSSCLLYTSRCV